MKLSLRIVNHGTTFSPTFAGATMHRSLMTLVAQRAALSRADFTSLRRRHWFGIASALALGAAAFLCSSHAQDGSLAAKGAGVKIGFVPPPIEGTFSLGVYDKAGKLVRTLRSDAEASEFTVALNGFVVVWDGKDDSGKPVSAGKYRLLGVAVGDIDVAGEAYHGNDWMLSEDAPRLVNFHGIKVTKIGNEECLELSAEDLNHAGWKVSYALGDSGSEAVPSFEKAADLDASAAGPMSCPGPDGSRWSIEKVLGETVVVQFDAQGEVARRLSIGVGEPVPVAIAASASRDEIFLLEQELHRTRLRGLRKLTSGKPPLVDSKSASKSASSAETGAPAWETFIEKNRWNTPNFDASSKHIGRTKPLVPEKKIRIKTKPNPLIGDVVTEIELMVGFDAEGSFLRTADGLRLRRLSGTPHLAWVVFGRESRQPSVVVLQGDGAVVEEFRIGAIQEIMTFDAGEYQWPPK